MRPHGVVLTAALAALTCASCDRTPAAEAPVPQATSAASASGGTAPHGDHNPHHGGIVMMKGEDVHYELVLDRTGAAHRVYFTDAVRDDLPASVASDVVLTIHRPGRADERVPLHIDDAGESWVGSGDAAASPAPTSVRVAFVIRREPYWIDLPLASSR